MNIILPENDEEALVSSEAIRSLRFYRDDIRKQEEFLKTQKFPMGTIVAQITSSQLDNVFGISENKPGKIVGYDFKNKYYRVFFSEHNPYIGVKEERLTNYEGEVPACITNKNPYEIKMLHVSV